jgi:hypothetical protein
LAHPHLHALHWHAAHAAHSAHSAHSADRWALVDHVRQALRGLIVNSKKITSIPCAPKGIIPPIWGGIMAYIYAPRRRLSMVSTKAVVEIPAKSC